MKKIVRNLTLVGCVGSSAIAAPFLAIGDNAELFVTADAIVAYNDNILLASGDNELRDTIFTFRPGFDLQFGKDSAIKGNLIGDSTLTSYADNTNLNNQLLGVAANVEYNGGGPLTLNASASFNELDQPSVDVLSSSTLIERDVTNAAINGEWEFSEKISTGSGLSYRHTDYKAAGYIEDREYSVPVNIYYELTPKVDVSTGVRYTRTDLDQDDPLLADRYDAIYYNVGARGVFTPKLSGNFSVGYNTRNANLGRDDDGSLGADAFLAYAYSEKTKLNLGLSRDFKNSSLGGESYENSQITLSAVNALTVNWRLNASATYRLLDYGDRTDTSIEGSLGATYIINNYLSTGLTYTYREKSTDDDTAGNEFKNNLVSLSLSARY